MTSYYQDDFVTIYHGDSREIVPSLGKFDLCLTDPPYGLGKSDTNKNNYLSYDDNEENLISLISNLLPSLRLQCNRTVLTCGVGNLYRYPKPTWIMCWATPAGVGSGPWGFCCWQPILCYGPDPYLSNGLGRRSDLFVHTESSSCKGHPCSKPIQLWSKILSRVQIDMAGLILDPFCGSGTTGRAAKNLGRKCVLIEIEEQYCEIAAMRMQREMLF